MKEGTAVNKPTDKEEVTNAVSYLKERFRKLAVQYNNEYLGETCRLDLHLAERLTDYTTRCYDELERNLKNKEVPDPTSYFTQTGYAIHAGKTKNRKLIARVKSDYLYNSRKLFLDFQETSLHMQRDVLKEGHEWIFREISKIIEDSPDFIKVNYDKEELIGTPGDKVSAKLFKFRKRTWARLTRRPIIVKIPFKELLTFHLPGKLRIALYTLLKSYGKSGFRRISGYQAVFAYMKQSFNEVEESLIRGDFSHELLEKEKGKVLELIKRTLLEPSNGKSKSSVGEVPKLQSTAELANAAEDSVEVEGSQPRDLFDEVIEYDLPANLKTVIEDALTKTIALVKADLNRPDINGLLSRRKQMQLNTGEKLRKKIAEVPDLWYRNQTLFLSGALLDLMLQTAQVQLGAVVQKVMSKVQDNFDNNVLDNLDLEHKQLGEFAALIKDDPFAEFKSTRSDWGYARDKVFYKEINEKLLADVKETLSIFPETIEIMGESRPARGKKGLDQFEGRQFEKTDSVSISLNRLVNYLILTHLSEPIRLLLSGIPLKLEKTITIAEDVTRLISFSLNNPDRDFTGSGSVAKADASEKPATPRKEDLQKSIIDFVNEGDLRIQKELAKVRDQKKVALTELPEALKKTVASLEPDQIISSAGNLKEYIKKTKKRTSLLDRFRSIKPGLRNKIAKIWYRRSESLLAARKLSLSSGKLSISAAMWKADEEDGELRLDELLTIIEGVSPDLQVLDKLPFYYRQLFLGKQNVDRAFWTGRGTILLEARKAIHRFRQSLARQDSLSTGGLLILGEQNAGKTYLSQYIAGKYFNKRKIYQVNPPDAGSIDINVFGKSIQKVINDRDDLKVGGKVRSLKDVGKDSVFIFNDIELWWERSKDGLVVIEQILKVINEYGGRLFFIFNGNIHSFRYINRLTNFSDSFQKMLECEPFSAEEIKDIVLFRHKSTGIKYRLNNTREDDISGWRQARLFSKHFNYSKGNVGVALNAWISNIHTVSLSDKAADLSVSKGTGLVKIKEAKIPNLDRLRYMNPDWLLIIIQFILHKRMTVAKLKRVSHLPVETVIAQVNLLRRAGVIVYSSPGRIQAQDIEDEPEVLEEIVYELNQFLRPHLVNDLVERGVL
ncbi:MAG TPA: hypothetical protein EYN71_07120 [Flavobacteriales bacterium]|nr:hypothetical protein [Flavobacteriales bacterium]